MLRAMPLFALLLGVPVLGSAGDLAPPPAAAVDAPTPVQRPVEVPLASEAVAWSVLGGRGTCCPRLDLRRTPPKEARQVPKKVGRDRRFGTIPIADSRFVVSVEELPTRYADEPASLLVRLDVDGDGGLGNDELQRCDYRSPCGPFTLRVQRGRHAFTYPLMLNFFRSGRRASDLGVGYTRGGALVGRLAGRQLMIVDENTNGRFDDPEDVVILDVDGDGELVNRFERGEAFPRHHALPVEGGWISLGDADPVAGRTVAAPTRTVQLAIDVVDLATGEPVPDAKVHVLPGDIILVADDQGRARGQVLDSQVDRITILADGYWAGVFGQSNRAPEPVEGRAAPARHLRFPLEPGPCRHGEMVRCGREQLRMSSATRSSVDLESGVLGPRVSAFPGPPDVGWWRPPGRMLLGTLGEARLRLLDTRDFEAVTPEALGRVEFPESRDDSSLHPGPRCRVLDVDPEDPELVPGAVIAVRTQEGHLGKLRVRRCDQILELDWVLYPTPTGGLDPAPGSREDTPGSDRSVIETP